jgi:hypothetical protein
MYGGQMNDTASCYCPECGWTGDDPVAFDQHQWLEITGSLRPGDTAPRGICPACSASARTAILSRDRLITIENAFGDEDAAAEAWDVDVYRTSSSYLAYFVHPLGYGCEIMLEISGERPSITITPFNERDAISDAEPIAYIKVGEDHVLFTNGPHYPATVVADETSMKSHMIQPGRWRQIRRWNDRIV